MQVRLENDIPPDEVIGFNNASQLDNFLYNNQNTTQGGMKWFPFISLLKAEWLIRVHSAYIFNVTQDGGGNTIVGFALQSNETNGIRYGKIINYATYVQVPMMVSLQRQLCTLHTLALYGLFIFTHPQ